MPNSKGHWTFCPVAFFCYCGIIYVKLYSSTLTSYLQKGDVNGEGANGLDRAAVAIWAATSGG